VSDNASNHVRYAVLALSNLYVGGSRIIIILLALGRAAWLVSGLSRPLNVPYSADPTVSIKSLRICREFAICQISTVSTESVLVVDALLLTSALSTPRSAHRVYSRRASHISGWRFSHTHDSPGIP
jgi:hypothetical protein